MSPATRKAIIATIDAFDDKQIGKVLEALKAIKSGKPAPAADEKAEESKILASRMGLGRTASGCQIFRG